MRAEPGGVFVHRLNLMSYLKLGQLSEIIFSMIYFFRKNNFTFIGFSIFSRGPFFKCYYFFIFTYFMKK